MASELELLNQIAIDVAVIKSKIERIDVLEEASKELKSSLEKQKIDYATLKTKVVIIQGVVASVGLGILGFVLKNTL